MSGLSVKNKNNNCNYYKVKVLAGHCAHMGSKYREYLTFYFEAPSIFSAIEKAKKMPGVKHNKEDVVQNVQQVSKEEYEAGVSVSAYGDRRE